MFEFNVTMLLAPRMAGPIKELCVNLTSTHRATVLQQQPGFSKMAGFVVYRLGYSLDVGKTRAMASRIIMTLLIRDISSHKCAHSFRSSLEFIR